MSTFFCSLASRAEGEDLYGTAPLVKSALMVEWPGPWTRRGFDDLEVATAFKASAQTHEALLPMKVLLVRRAWRTDTPLRVTLSKIDVAKPYSKSWSFSSQAGMIKFLPSILTATQPDVEDSTEQFYLVCTHGKRDKCCAKFGQRIANALIPRHSNVFASAHVGGDRFAANLVCLPYGLYYGRLDLAAAERVIEAHGEGRLVLEHLRGRCSYPFVVQAAEYHLRRFLNDDVHMTSLAFVERLTIGPNTSVVRFEHMPSSRSFEVTVERGQSKFRVPATCSSKTTRTVPQHILRGIREFVPKQV